MKAFAVLGSHRHIYSTVQSPNPESRGRLQVYESEKDALNNAHSSDEVVPVRIIIPRRKKESASAKR